MDNPSRSAGYALDFVLLSPSSEGQLIAAPATARTMYFWKNR